MTGDCPPVPAAMRSAVPSTGKAARYPGHASSPLMSTTEPSTSTSPTPAATARCPGRRRVSSPTPTASRAPTPSSQARGPNQKNAHGCEYDVSHTQATNDTATMTPRTTARRRRWAREDTTVPTRATATSAGQTT
jgi:hypothetical protein